MYLRFSGICNNLRKFDRETQLTFSLNHLQPHKICDILLLSDNGGNENEALQNNIRRDSCADDRNLRLCIRGRRKCEYADHRQREQRDHLDFRGRRLYSRSRGHYLLHHQQ